MSDDYYRFDSIDFHFCSISMNITNAMPTAVPTPAPTDYIYNDCPNYKAELSDYIQLENYTTNSQIASFYAASSGVYTYNFRDNPIKHSEWLLKSKTYIEMDSLHSSSLRVTVNIGTAIGCTNEVITVKDIKTEYCSVQWKYGLDLCEDITQTIELNLWSDTNKETIGTELVHDSFHKSKQNVNVNYNNIPPHELIDITTSFYIQRSVLSQGDVIEFLITLVRFFKFF